MKHLDTFTRAHIEALYFADTGEDDQPPTEAELSEETRLDLAADCRSFWKRYWFYILSDQCKHGGTEEERARSAGHDFWFTRNGHGAGFWDGDWPTYGDILTEGSKSYGNIDLGIDDNGAICI